jgi:hypothetical protein
MTQMVIFVALLYFDKGTEVLVGRLRCGTIVVSRIDSITTLPAEFITAIVTVSLWTSMPTYFVLSIDGAPFCRGMRSTLKPYRKRGARL